MLQDWAYCANDYCFLTVHTQTRGGRLNKFCSIACFQDAAVGHNVGTLKSGQLAHRVWTTPDLVPRILQYCLINYHQTNSLFIFLRHLRYSRTRAQELLCQAVRNRFGGRLIHRSLTPGESFQALCKFSFTDRYTTPQRGRYAYPASKSVYIEIPNILKAIPAPLFPWMLQQPAFLNLDTKDLLGSAIQQNQYCLLYTSPSPRDRS